MISLGIDPGTDYFAWAYFDSECGVNGSFVGWGKSKIDLDSAGVDWGSPAEGKLIPLEDVGAVGIEDISWGGYAGVVDKNVFETAFNVGRLDWFFRRAFQDLGSGAEVILVHRSTIAGRWGNSQCGDSQINRAMASLYPELVRIRAGLNSHTRSACAVAEAAASLAALQGR